MLSRALRVGPTVDGQPWLCHCEAVVAPYPQPLIGEVINFLRSQEIKFEGCRIDADTPKEDVDKSLCIPYLERAYDEHGFAREGYNTHSAFVTTVEACSKATHEAVDFAGTRVEDSCAAATSAS